VSSRVLFRENFEETAQGNVTFLLLSRAYSIKIGIKEGIMPNTETAALMALLMAFAGLIIIACLLFHIYLAVCLQIIAKKTGRHPTWLAWIPAANLFLMCKIGRLDYKWLLLLLVFFVPLIGPFLGPICALFWTALAWYKIAIARGKEGWIGAITVIPMVGLFTMGYLTFSK
jgi:hypothetical protein